MRAKSLILLVIALGCGMIAAVAVSKAVMDKGTAQQAEETVEIFVAVKDLPHAERISAENVKLEKWPKKRVPEGALFQLEQLEDKFTNQTIFANEPILQQKIGDSRESFSTGVPPGYRIFDIPGSAGYIKPGDHVDILGTFRIGGRNAPPESRTVMRNVKVHGINGITIRDSDKQETAKSGRGGSVFQLLVKESQLEALTLANSLGDLQLNLRPFGEDEDEHSTTDNGESFLTWVHENKAGNDEESEPDEEPPGFLAQSMTMFSSPPEPKEEPKNQMYIITPNGVKTYEWSRDGELPKEVVPEPDPPANNPGAELPANGYGGASGNVYSGYGGYSPTYPTSVNPSAPVPDGETPASEKEAPKIE